jgi:thiamine kinase-like enzyme
MGAAGAVALLSATTGETYELVGRLSGGETGAHEVRGPSEARLVVKWETEPSSILLRSQAVGLSERLRTEAGWPTPGQRTVGAEGCLFVLQEFMPGSPVEVLSHGVVDRLLELHARRLGLARSNDPSHWPDALIRTLTEGGEGYCVHESLRRHDERTARLVTKIEEFGGALRGDALVGHDIVHWDLHPGNLLEDDGKLSAVVDTDFAVVGDAAFDLVTLALSCLAWPSPAGVRDRLFAAAFDDLGDLQRRAYLGHLFIRFIDWPIRRGRVEEIDFWLAQADQWLDL